MPTEMTNHREEGFTFKEVPVTDILQGRYSDLDPECLALINNSKDRMPWRLYVHQPYTVSLSLVPSISILNGASSIGTTRVPAFWATLLIP